MVAFTGILVRVYGVGVHALSDATPISLDSSPFLCSRTVPYAATCHDTSEPLPDHVTQARFTSQPSCTEVSHVSCPKAIPGENRVRIRAERLKLATCILYGPLYGRLCLHVKPWPATVSCRARIPSFLPLRTSRCRSDGQLDRQSCILQKRLPGSLIGPTMHFKDLGACSGVSLMAPNCRCQPNWDCVLSSTSSFGPLGFWARPSPIAS